jgi:hypothetical protein
MSVYVFSENQEGIFGDSTNKVVRLGPDGAKYPIRVHMDHVDIGPKSFYFNEQGQMVDNSGIPVFNQETEETEARKEKKIGNNYTIVNLSDDSFNIVRGNDWKTGYRVFDLDAIGNTYLHSSRLDMSGLIGLGSHLELQHYQNQDGFQITNGTNPLIQLDERGKLGFPSVQSDRMDRIDAQFRDSLGQKDQFTVYYGDYGDHGYSMEKNVLGDLIWSRGKNKELKPVLKLTQTGDVRLTNDVYSLDNTYVYKKHLLTDSSKVLCILGKTDDHIIGRLEGQKSQMDIRISPKAGLLDLQIHHTFSASSSYLLTCQKKQSPDVSYYAIYSDTLFKNEEFNFTGNCTSEYPYFVEVSDYDLNSETVSNNTSVLQNADTYMRHGRLAINSSYPIQDSNSLEVQGDTLIYGNNTDLIFKHKDSDQNNAILFCGSDLLEQEQGRKGQVAASIRYWDGSNSLVLEANRIEGRGDVHFTSNVTASNRVAVRDSIRPAYTWDAFEDTGMYYEKTNNQIRWCIDDIDTMNLSLTDLTLLNNRLRIGESEFDYDKQLATLNIQGNLSSLYSWARDNYFMNCLYTGNVRNTLDDGQGNVILTAHTCNSGGALLSIMNNTDGGTRHGLRMMSIDNTDWGIYLGKTTSMAGIIDENSSQWTLRNRIPTDAAFLWEKSDETALLNLEANSGNLNLLQGDALFEHAVYGGSAGRWFSGTSPHDDTFVMWSACNNMSSTNYALQQNVDTNTGETKLNSAQQVSLRYQDIPKVIINENKVINTVPVDIQTNLKILGSEAGIDFDGGKVTCCNQVLKLNANTVRVKANDLFEVNTPVVQLSESLYTGNNTLDDGKGNAEIQSSLDVNGPSTFRDDINIASGDMIYRDSFYFPKFASNDGIITGPAFFLICAATENIFGRFRDDRSFLVEICNTDMTTYTQTPNINLITCVYNSTRYLAIHWKDQNLVIPNNIYFTGTCSGALKLQWVTEVTNEEPALGNKHDMYLQNANLRTGSGKVGINIKNEVDPRAYLDVNGDVEFRSNVLTRGHSKLEGGGLYNVMSNVNGGAQKGIRMLNIDDPRWGLYMSTNGGLSMRESIPVSGYDFGTDWVLRTSAAKNINSGFIWENSSEERLMSLNAFTGRLYVQDEVASKGYTFSEYPTTGMYNNTNNDLIFRVDGSDMLSFQNDETLHGIFYSDIEVKENIYLSPSLNTSGIWSSNGIQFTSKDGYLQFHTGKNPEWKVLGTGGQSLFEINELNASSATFSNTLDDGLGNMVIKGELEVDKQVKLLGGGLISIMDGEVDGRTKGIRMNTIDDPAWSIYLADSSLGGVTPNGSNPIRGYDLPYKAMRFRASNEVGQGFVWENNDETLSMSLSSWDSLLYVGNKVLTAGQNVPGFSFHNDEGTGLGSRTSNHLSLETAGQEHLTVIPSGYVGIGTNAPTHRLHVNDSMRVTDSIYFTSSLDTEGLISSAEQGTYLEATNLNFKFKNTANDGHAWQFLSSDTRSVLSLYNVTNRVETQCNVLDTGEGNMSVLVDFDAAHKNFKIRETIDSLNMSLESGIPSISLKTHSNVDSLNAGIFFQNSNDDYTWAMRRRFEDSIDLTEDARLIFSGGVHKSNYTDLKDVLTLSKHGIAINSDNTGGNALYLRGNQYLDGTLTATSNVQFQDELKVSNKITTNVFATNAIQIGSSNENLIDTTKALYVEGKQKIEGTLEVTSNAAFNLNILCGIDMFVNNSIQIGGPEYALLDSSKAFYVVGDQYIDGTLEVTSNVQFDDELRVSNKIITSNVFATNAIQIGSSDILIDSTKALYVEGNQKIEGTLDVTENSTFNNITCESILFVKNAAQIGYDGVLFDSTKSLYVLGNQMTNGTLDVAGDFRNTATSYIEGLQVSYVATFSNNVTMLENLVVTSNVSSIIGGTFQQPGYSLGSSKSSGIFGNDDILGISVGGVQYVTLGNNGNFGIGTSNPADTLDVAGNSHLRGTLDMHDNDIINVKNLETVNVSSIGGEFDNQPAYSVGSAKNTGMYGNDIYLALSVEGTINLLLNENATAVQNDFNVYGLTSMQSNLNMNNNEIFNCRYVKSDFGSFNSNLFVKNAAQIGNSGDVLIDSTKSLYVQGNQKIDGTLDVTGDFRNNGTSYIEGLQVSDVATFSNNVTMLENLVVTSNVSSIIGGTFQQPGYSLGSFKTSGIFGNDGILGISVGGVQYVTLANNGNFGIGTSYPADTLDVAGNSHLRGTLDMHGNDIINASISMPPPFYKGSNYRNDYFPVGSYLLVRTSTWSNVSLNQIVNIGQNSENDRLYFLTSIYDTSDTLNGTWASRGQDDRERALFLCQRIA